LKFVNGLLLVLRERPPFQRLANLLKDKDAKPPALHRVAGLQIGEFYEISDLDLR